MSYHHFAEPRLSDLSSLRQTMDRDTKYSRFSTLSNDDYDDHDRHLYFLSRSPVEKTASTLIVYKQPDRKRYDRCDSRHPSGDRREARMLELSRTYRPDLELPIPTDFSRPQSTSSRHYHCIQTHFGSIHERDTRVWSEEGRDSEEESFSRYMEMTKTKTKTKERRHTTEWQWWA
ncbi:hypothetical protein HBH98_254920 [Parastagonospora nodorum]|nr:hypothetical protein HBH53_263930 [Parastagonospora nodorum]KAH3955972.1 hypothetical protein HBH51_259280 [Parastagonospora nodorum]KAH4215270.1 hypothetical protein HBI06_257950 [Parastagonospora nodorum]KAH4220933.1 hypothetical protein HBI05_256300 [Parastagonospora nodorum]KAH4332095.1 hypothetical protein HBH98_254920 [Parastagonospora nodorum]